MERITRDHQGGRPLAGPLSIALFVGGIVGCNLPPLSGTPPPFVPAQTDSGDGDGTTLGTTGTEGGPADSEASGADSATTGVHADTMGSGETLPDSSGSGNGTTTGDTDPIPAWPPFNDCFNHDPVDACSDVEVCVLDDPNAPGAGVCAHPCLDASDCPFAPAADPSCVDFDGDGQSECVIDCMLFGCPDDMLCVDESVCMWPEHGFAACAEDPGACLEGESCLQFDNPPWSVCSRTGCEGDVGVCPRLPPGGDALVACYLDWDVDGLADCTVACGLFGQTCPIGMVCQNDTVCAWLPEADLSCADEDLGSALGQPVATGSTVDAGDNFMPGCVGTSGQDWAMAWTAPYTGFFIFDSQDSSFDTVLYALAGCGGAELACNDDAVTSQASIAFFLQKNESVLIVIDGFAEAGDFSLSIK